MVAKSVALFVAAAIAEIGGAYLVWVAIKEGRGLLGAPAACGAQIRRRRRSAFGSGCRCWPPAR